MAVPPAAAVRQGPTVRATRRRQGGGRRVVWILVGEHFHAACPCCFDVGDYGFRKPHESGPNALT